MLFIDLVQLHIGFESLAKEDWQQKTEFTWMGNSHAYVTEMPSN